MTNITFFTINQSTYWQPQNNKTAGQRKQFATLGRYPYRKRNYSHLLQIKNPSFTGLMLNIVASLFITT